MSAGGPQMGMVRGLPETYPPAPYKSGVWRVKTRPAPPHNEHYTSHSSETFQSLVFIAGLRIHYQVGLLEDGLRCLAETGRRFAKEYTKVDTRERMLRNMGILSSSHRWLPGNLE